MDSPADVNLVEEIKDQWKRMWRDRFDDHVRAECIAGEDYEKLFVERGTVVLATRNFKPLTLQDIFETHKITNLSQLNQPSPHVGGWGKFVRTHISKARTMTKKRACSFLMDKKQPQQLKKGGRGWLHT